MFKVGLGAWVQSYSLLCSNVPLWAALRASTHEQRIPFRCTLLCMAAIQYLTHIANSLLTIACESALVDSRAVWRTSTRTLSSRATASTLAVMRGPIRCELCRGTLTLMVRADLVVGAIVLAAR